MKKSKKKQRIAEYIFRTVNLLQQKSGKAENGLTLRQQMLLDAMRVMPQKTNLSALAERFGGSRQNLRQLVGALSAKGFVRTERSERDKRELIVSLTDKAEQCKETDEGEDGALQTVFKGIGEKNLDGALACLEQMMENLEKL